MQLLSVALYKQVRQYQRKTECIFTVSPLSFAVSLPVMNHTTCEEKYQTITSIGPSQFCAGFEGRTFVKDACSGDSGGPMVVMVDGKWFLSGLVSFGMGCGMME